MPSGRRQFLRCRRSPARSLEIDQLECRAMLAPVFQNPYVIASEQASPALITLTRYDNLDKEEKFRFTTSDGTATAGLDYTAVDQIVTFEPSETTKSVPIVLVNDGQPEPDETVNITVSDLPGTANPGLPSTGILTIVDRADIIPPTVQKQRLVVSPTGAVTGMTLSYSEPLDRASARRWPTTISSSAFHSPVVARQTIMSVRDQSCMTPRHNPYD